MRIMLYTYGEANGPAILFASKREMCVVRASGKAQQRRALCCYCRRMTARRARQQ